MAGKVQPKRESTTAPRGGNEKETKTKPRITLGEMGKEQQEKKLSPRGQQQRELTDLERVAMEISNMGQNQIKINTRLDKNYQWEIFDKLFRNKIRTVDKHIGSLQEYLKPYAKEIYFDRKVELNNLIAEKQKSDQQKLDQMKQEFLSKQEARDIFQENKEVLVDIMKRYDIKHPLRGEEYEVYKKAYAQKFSKKIVAEFGAPNSFLSYKQDQRKTLEFSNMQSEDYIKQQTDKFYMDKLILRYRIYGRDGLSEREFQRLVELGMIKRRATNKKQRQKKRVKKIYINMDGVASEYTTDMSGSDEDNYEMNTIYDFQDNAEGNFVYTNEGFEVQPLCREIFGANASMISRKKKQLMNELKDDDSIVTFVNLPFNGVKGTKRDQQKKDGVRASQEVKKGKQNPFKEQRRLSTGVDIKGGRDRGIDRLMANQTHSIQTGAKNASQATQRNTGGMPNQTFQTINSPLSLHFKPNMMGQTKTSNQFPTIQNACQSPPNKILMPHLANKFNVDRKIKQIQQYPYKHETQRNNNNISILSSNLPANDDLDVELDADMDNLENRRGSSVINDQQESSINVGTPTESAVTDLRVPNDTSRMKINQQQTEFPMIAVEKPTTSNNFIDRASTITFDEFLIDKRSGATFKIKQNRGDGGSGDIQNLYTSMNSMGQPKKPITSLRNRDQYYNQNYSEMLNKRKSDLRRAQDMNSKIKTDFLQSDQYTATQSQMSPRGFRRQGTHHPSSLKQQQKKTYRIHEDQRKEGNPYKFKKIEANSSKSTNARKNLGGGRLNKVFMMRTPTLQDSEIKQLISKYPVDVREEDEPKEQEEDSNSKRFASIDMPGNNKEKKLNKTLPGEAGLCQQINQLDKADKSTFVKKRIEFLIKNIDLMGRISKQDLQDHQTQMVMQDIRQCELQKMNDILKEIEFTEPESIVGMYEYRQRDENDKIKIANEVSQEYKEGKLDPNKYVGRPKKKGK